MNCGDRLRANLVRRLLCACAFLGESRWLVLLSLRVGCCLLVNRGLRHAVARSQLQHDLLVIAQIHAGELGKLTTPIHDVRLVTLVALQELVLAEVSQNVATLLGHQHAGVLRIGQVDL